MARAGLRWNVRQLAEVAGVGKMTIVRFENEQSKSTVSTRALLRRTFEDEGVEFVDDYGVHIKKTLAENRGGKETG